MTIDLGSTDVVYELLIDAIVTQQLAPSQKVSENIINDRFGLSRSIARNVIERLVATRFLVSISPRVTQVAPLTLFDIKQNFLLRRMLLPEVFVLVAASSDFEGVQASHRLITSMVPCTDDASWLALLKANKRANISLCEKAGYPMLSDWAGQLEDIAMRIYWLYVQTTNDFPFSVDRQEQLLKVIRAGNPPEIRSTSNEMLLDAEERIIGAIFSVNRFNTGDLVLPTARRGYLR